MFCQIIFTLNAFHGLKHFQATISIKLDHCNSLLYGFPASIPVPTSSSLSGQSYCKI